MICPNCKLENPPSATQCDCGYSFSSNPSDQTTHYLRSILESVNSIRKLVLFWIVLTIVGAVVWGVIVGYEAARRQDAVQQLQKGLGR